MGRARSPCPIPALHHDLPAESGEGGSPLWRAGHESTGPMLDSVSKTDKVFGLLDPSLPQVLCPVHMV